MNALTLEFILKYREECIEEPHRMVRRATHLIKFTRAKLKPIQREQKKHKITDHYVIVHFNYRYVVLLQTPFYIRTDTFQLNFEPTLKANQRVGKNKM